MTNAEVVSRVLNGLRLLNKDQHISRRFVLNVALSYNKTLTSQKLSEGSIYSDHSLHKVLRCVRLRKEDTVSCSIVEFRCCKNLMRSVDKLPELIYSRSGSSVVSVTTIDDSVEFSPTTLQKYRVRPSRQFSHLFLTPHYYIHDGYLYLPDSEIELVNIVLIPASASDVKGCESCGASSCENLWLKDFVCPAKLTDVVIQSTLREVATYYKGVQVDENPNLTEHQKDQITR